MANYNRTKKEKSLNRRNNSLPIAKEKFCPVFLFFLVLLTAVLAGQAYASGTNKIVVVPFRIISPELTGSLNTDLQKMFSQDMKELGYQVVDPELVNRLLGDNISYSDPEKNIIPLGKTNDADWVIIGEITQKEGSIQLNVKVLDIDSAKTPFSVIMIVNGRKDLPQALKKIAESLGKQIKKNVVISKIIIKGSKRASDDAILNIIESKKGDPFDQDKLDRDLRTIYKMGFFDDVNYEISDSPDGKIITFNLTEKPTIIKISFQGNKRKKDDKLKEELGIKTYAVLDRNEIRQSINRLLDLYRNDGYYNVKITDKIKELPDNEVTLTYVIDEGEKVYIKNIRFKGNKVFDDDDLKDIMLTKEKGWLTWFTDSGVLDKKKLEFDLQKLRIFYDNHGYIKSRIGEPEITYDKKENGLTLTIPVVEGEQYRVNDIKVEGDLLVPEKRLRKLINVKKGDPFSRQVIFTEIDKIKGLYADMGYAYAEAEPSSKEIEGSNLVNVIIRVRKNKRVRIERINIYGNEITKDKVFRRELKLSEGDYFSSSKLKKSEENLDRIDLFESHEVKTRRGSSDDQMIIDIEGKEKLQRSISFSVGYGGYEKFMFSLQYADNNLFGRGENFSIDALTSSVTTQFNASFTEPWLFDKPVSGTIRAYNWSRDYDSYTREQVGGGVGLSFLLGLDDYTRGMVNYTYDKSKLTNIYTTSDEILSSAGDTLTSSVTLGIERNSKDRVWDTTKGSDNYFTFEYAGGIIGGDAGFNKYLLGSTFYIPVVWKTVLVVKTQLGLVQGRADGILPVYEKFFLGGIDSVRGYEWGSITPRAPLTYDQVGGDREWLYTVEYRFPLGKAQGMTGLIFLDTGNAFNKDTNWKTGAGASVGFGLRWRSPMGPLRLEYGYKLVKNRYDTESGRFEFKIGGSF